MDIRFDKDAKRATNGPLIFFSDTSSQDAFAEEVRGAILSGLSFYSYRMSGDMMISFGSSEGYLEGIEEPGFVIGMFDPEKPFITIPYWGAKKNKNIGSLYSFPDKSVSFEEYVKEIKGIISDLQEVKNGKVVAARVVIKEESLDLAETFFDLCNRFPEAMIFCFSTPVTGCWIGASPELLLEGEEGALNTMALAGTRLVSEVGEWDKKNIEEQRIVADYIIEKFSDEHLNPIAGEVQNKTAGNIQHICTPITASIPSNDLNLESLIRKLYPTPALCGNPKEFALEEIRKYESFDRGAYGGFCGPYRSLKDFHFNVVLRCASVEERRFCVYAGGGITRYSNVEDEWRETEIKMIIK